MKHNFYAGPAILPKEAINNSIEAIKDFAGTGLSLLEISHRSKEFDAVMVDAQATVKQLLNVPEGYEVLFLGGGASTQFLMVAYNFLKKKAAYLDTGAWASKAIKEAKLFGEVDVVASSKDKNYTYIPKGFSVPDDADYLHVTTNNTIYGTEILEDFDVKVPLIADMSSDFMSRPVDVSKYAMIYAGAQKNVGPAGTAVVIVKKDALGKVSRPLPTMMNYQTHIDKGSMFNTPPVYAVYTVLQTLKWLEKQGGVEGIEKVNIEKSNLLYEEIERNKLFVPTVESNSRSRMNVCFVMNENYKDLDKEFLDFATAKDIVGIKGHRSVGGFRASIYNALPKSSVEYLVSVMQAFEKAH